MVDQPLPSDIEDPGRVFGTNPIDSGEKETAAPMQPFSSYMRPSATPLAAAGKSSLISPFDLMQGQAAIAAAPSMDTLLSQIKNAQSTLGDINTQLNTPNLKLKASTKYLLKNKLSDANENLRSFNAKMGNPLPEPSSNTQFSGPLGHFFAYLNSGQALMQQAQQNLADLKNKGKSIAPGDFLLIQIKLNKAQQLLEFSSVLLSNAVSAFKQLMQVQL